MVEFTDYSFIDSVRAFEVEIVVGGGSVEELKYTVIADGFADCVEIMTKRIHELNLTPYSLSSIKALPRIMLTAKGLEALGGEIC